MRPRPHGVTPCTTVLPLGRCLVAPVTGLLEQHNQPDSTAGYFVFFTMVKLQKLRQSAFAKQNGCCFYCGHPMWERGQAYLFAQRYPLPPSLIGLCQSTAEHLQARQDGGIDSSCNIAAACKYCNATRHQGRVGLALSPTEYKKLIQKRIKNSQWHPAWSVLHKAKAWKAIEVV